MNAKRITTAALLLFVAASVVYLLHKETSAGAEPPAPAIVTPCADGAAGTAGCAPEAAEPRFVAYYFHTTRRCRTCNTIQALAAETIQGGFAKEIEAGVLAWLPVNVEQPGNEHFVTDYQVTGSTLVLAERKDGEPLRHLRLDKTWDLFGDKPRFVEYVTTELDSLMSGDEGGAP